MRVIEEQNNLDYLRLIKAHPPKLIVYFMYMEDLPDFIDFLLSQLQFNLRQISQLLTILTYSTSFDIRALRSEKLTSSLEKTHLFRLLEEGLLSLKNASQ